MGEIPGSFGGLLNKDEIIATGDMLPRRCFADRYKIASRHSCVIISIFCSKIQTVVQQERAMAHKPTGGSYGTPLKVVKATLIITRTI